MVQGAVSELLLERAPDGDQDPATLVSTVGSNHDGQTLDLPLQTPRFHVRSEIHRILDAARTMVGAR